MITPFGHAPGGHRAQLFTLQNSRGFRADITDYGATVVRLLAPDRHGQFADVVLGFDAAEGYAAHSSYFGATIGRVANRIAGASFELAGKRYQLAANNGPHHLHGGKKGWDKVVWSAEPVATATGVAVMRVGMKPSPV